jgi:hypothetical protein
MSFSNGSNGHHNDVPTAKQTVHGYINDIKSQLERLPENANVVKTFISALLTDGVTDDRK